MWLQALPIIAFLYLIIFGRLFWNCCLPSLWLEGVFIEPMDSNHPRQTTQKIVWKLFVRHFVPAGVTIRIPFLQREFTTDDRCFCLLFGWFYIGPTWSSWDLSFSSSSKVWDGKRLSIDAGKSQYILLEVIGIGHVIWDCSNCQHVFETWIGCCKVGFVRKHNMHSDARDLLTCALEVGKLFFFDTLMVDPLTRETWPSNQSNSSCGWWAPSF